LVKPSRSTRGVTKYGKQSNTQRKLVPGFEKAALIATGSILGVRETRRVVGRHILSADDFENRRSFDDEIGRYGRSESSGISYRCFVPRDVANPLTAGRCISAERGMVEASERIGSADDDHILGLTRSCRRSFPK
jgi:hypothetical protein